MASRVATLGYMQTRGFKTFIASDLNEIFSLTLAPRLMKTCYYTCHVASHQKQPQPILGPNPHRSPHVHAPFICSKIKLFAKFWGVAHSCANLSPRPSSLSHPLFIRPRRPCRGQRFLSQRHWKLIFHFIYSFKHALSSYVS